MRRPLLIALVALGPLTTACEDGVDPLVIEESGSTLLVDSDADDGDGSLRAALATASADPEVTSIQVAPAVGTVTLASTLTYTGAQPLRILGNGLTVEGGDCACDLFVSSGGADLTLRDLTLREGRTGLLVEVPASRTGVLEVRLDGLTVSDNERHGIHVDDRSDASGADVLVELVNSTIEGNGFEDDATDFDGILIEEAGAGRLTFTARGAEVTGNAGDGIQLSEEGAGSVLVDVLDSEIDGNGEQPQDIDAPQEGFDIDEAGPGSLDVRLVGVSVANNDGEGLDFDERGAGDLRASLTDLTANGNGDGNVELAEDADAEGGGIPGAGSLTAILTRVTARGGDADGVRVEEFGAGDLTVNLHDSVLEDNDGDGLAVVQAGTGAGLTHLVRVTTDGNGGLAVSAQGSAVTQGDDRTTTVLVRTDLDAGFGSLRAAVEAANASSTINTIEFETGIANIELDASLEYTGEQPLRIYGRGVVIEGEDCECDLLVVSGRGDVVLEDFTFRQGPQDGISVTGGGDLTLRDVALRDIDGNGLFVEPPMDADGTIRLTLDGVGVIDNGLHGIHVDDLAGGAVDVTGHNSPAGIVLELLNSIIQGNGFRVDVTDRDGVRIDEGGAGTVELRLVGTDVLGNAGDGIQVMEAGLGGVLVDIRGSQLNDNGRQPQNPDDLDDGLDVDETGPGSMRVRILETSVSNNFEEGIDLDETGSGGVDVTLETVTATNNNDENIEISEDVDARGEPSEGSGDLVFHFSKIAANSSDTDGVLLEEFGVGTFTGQMLDSSIRFNGGDGIHAVQEGDEDGFLQLVRAVLTGNAGEPFTVDGVEVTELPPEEGGSPPRS